MTQHHQKEGVTMLRNRVRIFRNRRLPGRAWFMSAKLPVRQRLIFIGPLLGLIQPR